MYYYCVHKLESTIYTVFVVQETKDSVIRYGFASRSADIKCDFEVTAKEHLSREVLTEIARVSEEAYKLGYQHAVNDMRMIREWR